MTKKDPVEQDEDPKKGRGQFPENPSNKSHRGQDPVHLSYNKYRDSVYELRQDNRKQLYTSFYYIEMLYHSARSMAV